MKRFAIIAAALFLSAAPAVAGWNSRDSNYNRSPSGPAVGMITPTLGLTTNFTSGSTVMFSPAVGNSNIATLGSATNRKIPIPISGNLFGLNANFNVAQALGIVTDIHNGVNGSITCNMSVSPNTNCNSGALTEHFVAGDFLEWKLDPGGTWVQTTTPANQYSWLFQADVGANNSFMLSGPTNSAIAGSTVNAYQGFGTVYNSSVVLNEPAASSIIPVPGNILGLYVSPNATEHATNNHIYTLWKNGAATGITCSGALNTSTGCCVNVGGTGVINGGPACTSITVVPVVAGDTISLNINCASGACNAVSPGASIIWNPTVAGQAVFTAQNANAVAANQYIGMQDTAVSGAQVNWSVTPQVTGTMTLSNLVFCVGAAPTGVTTRTATVQFSATPIAPATNSALASTITSTTTPCLGNAAIPAGFQDTTHSFTVGAAYSLNHFLTISGAPPSASYFKLGLVATIP